MLINRQGIPAGAPQLESHDERVCESRLCVCVDVAPGQTKTKKDAGVCVCVCVSEDYMEEFFLHSKDITNHFDYEEQVTGDYS